MGTMFPQQNLFIAEYSIVIYLLQATPFLQLTHHHTNDHCDCCQFYVVFGHTCTRATSIPTHSQGPLSWRTLAPAIRGRILSSPFLQCSSLLPPESSLEQTFLETSRYIGCVICNYVGVYLEFDETMLRRSATSTSVCDCVCQFFTSLAPRLSPSPSNFYILDPQVSAFCSLVPKPHPV